MKNNSSMKNNNTFSYLLIFQQVLWKTTAAWKTTILLASLAMKDTFEKYPNTITKGYLFWLMLILHTVTNNLKF